MAWTPKSAAPVNFNLGEAFLALITGDAEWGWLVGWVPLIGGISWNTADFCAAGPPAADAGDLTIFLPDRDRGVIDTARNLLARVATLRTFAEARVFGAFCQEPEVLVGGYGPYCFADVASTHGSFGDDQKVIVCDIPPAATLVIPGIVSKAGSVGNVVLYAAQNTWTAPQLLILAGVSIGDDAPKNIGPAGTYKRVWGWIDGGPGSAHVRVKYNAVGPPGEFDLPPAGDPGALPPPQGTYTTIPDLGHELDNLEFKLEHVVAMLDFLTAHTALPAPYADDPVAAPPDTPVDVSNASGVVISLASVPAQADIGFGTPPLLHRLGRVSFGTDAAWFSSVDLVHNPLVVAPLPPGTTRVTVTTRPPITATITKLRAGK